MGSSFCCREDRRQSIYCNPAMRLSMWSRAPNVSGRSWATRSRLKSRRRSDERSPGSSKTRPAIVSRTAKTVYRVDRTVVCESVQLIEVRRQGSQIIRLQIYWLHTAVGHGAVGCMKQGNQLRVSVFLSNICQRTSCCCAYSSLSVAGVARLSLKECLALQHLGIR